ncbi:hypothetical protein PHIN8_03270 [Polynucleobacter sp. HIN8]|nr:hypothetical protein PHIN8_03270 [Polynucleobacter sp. HIN8]
MQVDQAKKYKELEQENTRLKNLGADLSLREVMLKEDIKGIFLALLGVKMPRSCSWIGIASLSGLPVV